jgi:hypothetical protein
MSNNYEGSYVSGGRGGIDGGDGNASTFIYSPFNSFYTETKTSYGYQGQGTTTRYFGESNGTLYATGGYGGHFSSFTGNNEIYSNLYSPGTGNGGNGGISDKTYDFTYKGAYKGSSGVAIIRWAEQ